jgi:hypothetical protein
LKRRKKKLKFILPIVGGKYHARRGIDPASKSTQKIGGLEITSNKKVINIHYYTGLLPLER